MDSKYQAIYKAIKTKHDKEHRQSSYPNLEPEDYVMKEFGDWTFQGRVVEWKGAGIYVSKGCWVKIVDIDDLGYWMRLGSEPVYLEWADLSSELWAETDAWLRAEPEIRTIYDVCQYWDSYVSDVENNLFHGDTKEYLDYERNPISTWTDILADFSEWPTERSDRKDMMIWRACAILVYYHANDISR